MELLERDHALDTLHRLLMRAGEGYGSLVFIGGEAGIGKTALVRAFGAALPAGSRVLTGMCDPLSTPRPHGPLHDIAEQARGGISRLRDEDLSRDILFRETLAELSAGEGAVILIIEDIHWADSGTLDLLRFLARRIESTRSLVLVTYRDEAIGGGHPVRRLLGDVATATGVHRLALRPLSESAVAILAERSGRDAAKLYAQTSGNPFFLTEILAAGGEGMPATVSDAVLSRVSMLTDAARAALEIAAVIGTAVEPWLLQEMAETGSGAIDECLAAGLLRESAHHFAFRHDLARVAIYDAIPAYRRAALHERVLRGLEAWPQADIDPARLAHHAEEAGDAEAVLRNAPRAARRAAALGAAREAAEQYARAIRFAAALPDGERLALLEAHESVAGLSGWGAAGIPLRREMIALARRCGDRPREADHLNWLALTQTLEQEKDEAQATARAARALLDQLAEGPVHARWHAHQSFWLTCFGDSHHALSESQRAFAIASRHDDFATMLYVLENLGSVRFTVGDEDGGRADLEQCARLAADAGLDAIFAMATVGLGIGLCGLLRLADADRFLCEAIAFIAEHGIDSQRYWATAALAEVRLLQGRWPEAAALSTQVLSTHPEDFPHFAPPARARVPAL
ncbi:MAG: ATP-binding protein, partial [Thermomicrobiales bacterium]